MTLYAFVDTRNHIRTLDPVLFFAWAAAIDIYVATAKRGSDCEETYCRYRRQRIGLPHAGVYTTTSRGPLIDDARELNEGMTGGQEEDVAILSFSHTNLREAYSRLNLQRGHRSKSALDKGGI